MSSSEEFLLHVEIARAAAKKTDSATVILDVGDVLSITGWFVITSGSSGRQVRALAASIEDDVALAGGPKPLRVEGLDSGTWVLVDYGDVIVHIFDDETRAFYDLERLWRDVPVLEWSVDPV
ncbi:MAG: ribosome silencing factor [Acidimicrobiales bacterium]